MVVCVQTKMVLASTTDYQQWIRTTIKKSATPFGTKDQFCQTQIIWFLLSTLVSFFPNSDFDFSKFKVNIIIISDQNNSQPKGGFNVLWEIYEKDDVADGTKEAFAGFFDKVNEVIDDVFDGSEYKKERFQDKIPKVRKALKNMAQKQSEKLETLWYICGTASRGN